jgi:ATP-dependent DNA helicase RecG
VIDLELSLTSLCTSLKGVGSKLVSHLKRLDITTLQDLLFHIPYRYEDRTSIKTISSVRPGDQVQIEGIITSSLVHSRKRKSFDIELKDDTGIVLLRFLNFSDYFVKLFKKGQKVRCYGEIRWGSIGYEMIHPEIKLLNASNIPVIETTLTPVYPATEGLTQYHLRKFTDQALALLSKANRFQDHLPSELVAQFSLLNLKDAIIYLHRPPAINQKLLTQGLNLAKKRLIFEELLAYILGLAYLKKKAKSLQAPPLHFEKRLSEQFLKSLPYELTSAQQKVIGEISQDLIKEVPMLRLVQGDVGSGKTVVAAVAALRVIESNLQTALMAPTELLAEQHYNTFSRWFQTLNISVSYLTSAIRGQARAKILQQLANGEIQLVIGTHALFQKEINFKHLGLIIIDEQHRFGVDQRLALLNKGIYQSWYPHQLILSATPIPRTLTMVAYGDLDCSTIDEMPPGRTPVTTLVLPNSRRSELILRIMEICSAGSQVYWVCTLIEESETLQLQAASQISQELKQELPKLKIATLHGKMKTAEKEQIMAAFKNKEIDLLVATTVIEVGVDVPNANLMVIENSERLGLSQLHQLRGRVGRGMQESYCILLYQSPLSGLAYKRLAFLKECHNGFMVAQKDLELRGPGEVLGIRQTGLAEFKVADLTRDHHLFPEVQKAANCLLQHYPQQSEALVERWLGNKHKFREV